VSPTASSPAAAGGTAREAGPTPADEAAPRSWQQELGRAFVDLPALLDHLGLSPEACGVSPAAAARFPLRVPRGFVARMRPGDPADPLLRQVLPVEAEDREAPGFGPDPVGDLASVQGPGLLRKYAGRALLVTTGACAVHCRYCFRREFPYGNHSLTPAAMDRALALLAGDPAITEVILSGGDPLSLSDRRLDRLLAGLAAIPHLERLRIHTRVPVVLPERVDAGLLRSLRAWPRRLVVVLHANHPRELDAATVEAARRLAGVAGLLLNQSVLLRTVNDDVDTLASLSTALFHAGVLPYYLHQLDRVTGTAHFAVEDERAREIHAALAARLPGYLVPRLVREVAGAPAKMPL
jgi:EF-P beta-lysylation protein EpmB